MRISDWSSDVCSSDLLCVERADSGEIGLLDRLEGLRVCLRFFHHLVCRALRSVAGDDSGDDAECAWMLVGAVLEVPVGELVRCGVGDVLLLAAGPGDVETLAVHAGAVGRASWREKGWKEGENS